MKERIQNLSPAWRWALIVAAGCVAMAALNVWWIATYRHGYPMDVDENGYTMIGVIDFLGFENNGLSGWWEAVQNQTPNAPLLPALTSIVLIFNPGVLQGFGVLVAFGTLLTLATYGVAERLAGPRLGALAALAVATSQGVFVFTREYIFALPTAAFLTCAVYALIRSFTANHVRFHAADGSGYAFLADQVIALDAINPQVAARMARGFDRWKKFDERRKAHAKAALERIRETKGLSRDVAEIVTKALA